MRHLSNQQVLNHVVYWLYQAARLSRRTRVLPARSSTSLPKVVQISPSYFSEDSLIGGGERYVTSLAKTLANGLDTRLVSFGPSRRSFRDGNLKVEIYPALTWLAPPRFDPLNYTFIKELITADVIHCHQYRTVVTNLAILAGAAFRKNVFVTDHGGWGQHFTDSIPMIEFVTGLLPVSAFSATTLSQLANTQIIYGGVDDRFLSYSAFDKPRQNVLFVGRLMPHKGINYLIEAVGTDIPLQIIGRVNHEGYCGLLQQLAVGKQVHFVTDASDEVLVEAYRQAVVTVLPSVYNDVYGNQQPMPELMGLVLLESMASGTPVICTEVGGMPEFVIDGVTGYVVPPNDPDTLRQRISYLFRNPDVAQKMGQQARENVLTNFTWEAVTRRCLSAYKRREV